MSQAKALQRSRLACVLALAFLTSSSAISQDGNSSQNGSAERNRLKEPVYRVAKHPEPAKLEKSASIAKPTLTRPTSAAIRPKSVSTQGTKAVGAAHPLDEALEIARDTLQNIETSIKDYTCTLVKRERINGKLLEHEFITCKIRHEEPGGKPFGVYMKFKNPSFMKGREVVYVKGENDGNLIAHEGGFKGRFLPTMPLKPTSALAMRNQRYPITEVGLMTLTQRLIEKGERDRELGPCKVRILRGAKVSKRPCTCIEVRHDDRRPEFDFHVARVFVDSELNIPIRYEAYEWPSRPGGKMQLIEEYTYVDVKLNVGLTDKDFDTSNPSYNF